MEYTKRFKTLSENDLQTIINNRLSVNTDKATESALRIMLKYLAEKGVDVDTLDKIQLDSYLYSFYAEVRTEKGIYFNL